MPPYRSFIEETRPQLRFHYRAIEHLLDRILYEEAAWDAFFEHCGIDPILVLYENFAGDYRDEHRESARAAGPGAAARTSTSSRA